MKSTDTKNHIILTIERETFMLPPGKNISDVLNVLSGLRKVKDEYYYQVEPNRHVIVDTGEVEFSVSCARRELITEEEHQELRKADREAREKKLAATKQNEGGEA